MYNLLLFSIFCCHLVYFFRFGMFGPRKIWQPCRQALPKSAVPLKKQQLGQMWHFILCQERNRGIDTKVGCSGTPLHRQNSSIDLRNLYKLLGYDREFQRQRCKILQRN
jgi:hypothetical protein